MISIVTAYYNRKKLFINTLQSIKSQQFTGDLEVIAVDDGSREEERLEDLTEEFPFLKVIYLDPANKWYKNSCIPFNIGFRAAKGDKIIIQNPECFHYSPILQHVEDHLKENTYLSFGCFSLDKEATEMVGIGNVREFIPKIIEENNYTFPMDGMNGWYNHSVHRPEAYHFCSAIERTDLLDLGGFDERYANGVGVDDDELLYRIKLKGMKIIFEDDVIALHQNHYMIDYSNFGKIHQEKAELYFHNLKVFEQVTKFANSWRAGFLAGQESLQKSKENSIQRNYKSLLNQRIDVIAENRFTRKISLSLLNLLSKFSK